MSKDVKYKGVLTSYLLNGDKYTSYILGNDVGNINQAIVIRGLNEKVESTIMDMEILPDYSLLCEQEFMQRLPEIMHTCCFLGFVAVKSNTITIEDILGDNGVVHELSHAIADLEGCNKKSLTCIRDLVKRLQEKAIGFYEPV